MSRPLLPADLGVKRTVMAADRTLMAWLRTALSMVSFGFTIYKFLDTMERHQDIAGSHSPQRVGLFLCGMGTIAILLGTAGYWINLRDLSRIEDFRIGRPILIMSSIMCVASVAMMIGIANRLV
jgi:putative membrane protein